MNIAWVCDPDDRRGAGLESFCEERFGCRPKRDRDVRRLLDDPSVDAVVIATPDHWHALGTIWACQAGKHVYVEKPASHNVWEGRQMVRAARKYRRVVQVGTQNRSAPYNMEAVDYIRSGKLGEIHLCKIYNLKNGRRIPRQPDQPPPPHVDYDLWLGPAPARPFNPNHFHGGWYYYWAYCNGDTGNDGVHQIDLARWLIGRDYPKAVYATGGKFAFPDSDAEVPDTQVAVFEFDRLVVTFELTQYAPYMDKIATRVRYSDTFPYWPQCATRIELYGTKGLMVVGRHGGGWQVFDKAKEQSGPGEVVAQAYGRHPEVEHKEDFLSAIRDNRLPNADIEEGHRSAVMVHLACISTRLGGRKLLFDPATETTNDPEANELLKRQYRHPFVVPEEV